MKRPDTATRGVSGHALLPDTAQPGRTGGAVRHAQHEAHQGADTILDSITDTCFGLTSDWRFVYLNAHAREQMKILGKDPALLTGRVLWDEFASVPNEEVLGRVMSGRVMSTEELYSLPLRPGSLERARPGVRLDRHAYAALVGGRFDIESQPGKGTTLVVRIPIGRPATTGEP
jgi:hypothetical protein